MSAISFAHRQRHVCGPLYHTHTHTHTHSHTHTTAHTLTHTPYHTRTHTHRHTEWHFVSVPLAKYTHRKQSFSGKFKSLHKVKIQLKISAKLRGFTGLLRAGDSLTRLPHLPCVTVNTDFLFRGPETSQ